ncbi:MAG: ABC transporter permease [Acidobacteria bacterium]|nr:ABC transporter permease [Acidobacteriota bacterium]MCG3194702.1 Macrolide export ATP-binding/permease protein MacB [Thermoanaerobaculia bacterium]MCK6683621.1 ABC transporter permease [Thermoanaerobaculia bacterium]
MSRRIYIVLRRVLAENLRFAVIAIMAHKLRAFLTIVGIVIGTWTVIGMVALVTGFNRNAEASFSSFGATLVQFQKWEPRFGGGHRVTEEERTRPDLTVEDAEAIQRLSPSVLAVSPERYFWGAPKVKGNGEEMNAPTVAGGNQNYAICNNWVIRDGRNITELDVLHATDTAIIGEDVVQTLFKGKDPLGRPITINGRRVFVVGVFEKKGSSAFGGNPDTIVVIPITTFDKYFPQIKNSRGDTIHIATIPRSPELVERLVEEGTNILRARRKVPFNKANDFAVWTSEKLIEQMTAVTAAISGVLVFVAAIALLVGGVGVMNIMLVSVTERTREIGLRKSVGALRRDITLQFLTEAMTLTGLGGAVGVALGLLTAVVIRTVSPLPAETPLWSVGLGLGVSLSIGLFFGIYPAMKAARLDPIDALRYE